MKKSSRRQFLQAALGSAAAAGLISAGKAYSDEEATFPKAPDDFTLPKGKLGGTGLTPTLLGIGTGTNGWGGRSNQTELGKKQLISLLEYSYDRSLRYFDLADQYGSHPFMMKALDSGGGTVPRGKSFLLTKTHARTATEMHADLDRFRKELNTDYLDVVLLHCKFSGDWPETHAGAMEVLSEAKQKGVIKAHGVSCHSLSALKTAATSPWVDVDLARLNPWGRHMDADVDTVKSVLTEMRQTGKGVIGMKILAQGEASTPTKVDQGVKHAMTCGLLDCFTIGIANRQELDQLLGLMAKYSTP